MPEVLPDRLNAALFQFFHRLRHDLHTELGVGEYKLLFEAQEKGISLSDEVAVMQLCKTIWLKDQAQFGAFRKLFDAIIAPAFREKQEAGSNLQADAEETKDTRPDRDAQKKPVPETEQKPETPQPAPELSEAEALERIPDSEAAPDEGDLSIGLEQSGSFTLEDIEETPLSEAGISTHRFLLNERYLPVSPRDMQQHWRFLQNNFERGITPHIDLLRTVASIARRGILLEPVFQKRTLNRTHLLFLIDDSASMIAFGTLAQRLVEAALEDPFVTDEEVFYFSNAPGEQLYLNPWHTQSVQLSSLWRRCHRHTMMLIISDGGASRGQTDFERIQATHTFLKEARQHVQRIAWVNPMPRKRWEDTSAEYIARRVPMFETERIGLYKAIQTLKGKFV
ncbi:MAG: hypothetical protein SH848_11165 [Saprospiraceae bacterium]|nr:hypothetical protein [Saprospiraceae bacterium]MDZ4704481.1 hypothetical protein [Saprospiraceae bacterium]